MVTVTFGRSSPCPRLCRSGWYSSGGGSPQDEADSADVIAPGEAREGLGRRAVYRGGCGGRDGSILFSDIGNRIMRFDPKTGKTTVFREPSGRANGMIFDARGRLIVAEGANTGGGRRVSITERDGTVRTLADSYDGKRFNSPNDVAVDREGPRVCLRPALRRRRAARARFRGCLSDRFRGFCHPARHHGHQAQRAGASAPTTRRCISRTTAPAGAC